MFRISIEEITLVGLALAILEFSALAAAAHAVLHCRSAQAAIAWALSLITLPFLSLPIYLFFGRRNITGYAQTRQTGDLRFHQNIDAYHAACLKSFHTNFPERPELGRTMEKLAGLPITQCNKVQLLINGEASFKAIFAAIDKARDTILVAFFIIRDDELGNELKRRLIRKQQQGVQIYFMFDSIGCHRLPTGYRDDLTAAGVLVAIFGHPGRFRNRYQINFRNHRKIVVVDGQTGFVGGHNVGIEYLGRNPKYGFWRDTHMCLTGPAVSGLQVAFLEDWFWVTGKVPELAWNPSPVHDESAAALIIPTGPADRLPHCSFFFMQMLNAAQKRIWITSPYFVPNEAIIEALQLAALRGVDVRVLLPENPDKKLVWYASFHYLKEALPAGVRFFRYLNGFLHQKVMLVDDDLAVIGTANLDNRSLHLNFELSALVSDKKFAAEAEQMLTEDFQASREVTDADLATSLPFRVMVASSRLFSPLL